MIRRSPAPSWRAAEADLRGQASARVGPSFGDPWADSKPRRPRWRTSTSAHHQLEIEAAAAQPLRLRPRPGAGRRRRAGQAVGPEQAAGLRRRLPIPAMQTRSAARPDPARAVARATAAGVLAFQDARAAQRPPIRWHAGGVGRPRAPRRWPSASLRTRSSAIRRCARRSGTTALRGDRGLQPTLLIRYAWCASTPGAADPRSALRGGRIGPTTRAGEAIAKRGSRCWATARLSRTARSPCCGWPMERWPAGRGSLPGKTTQPFTTTFAGRASMSAPPAQRPSTSIRAGSPARAKLDPATIFNLSTTDDIIGGLTPARRPAGYKRPGW